MSRTPRTRWLSAVVILAVALGAAPALPAAAQETPPPGAAPGTALDDGAAPLGDVPAPPVPAQPTAAAPAAAGVQYSVVDLGDGVVSNASEVNEAGEVSGTVFDGGVEKPVLWRAGSRIELDRGEGSVNVRALSVGDDGTVGGWQRLADGTRYAVVWRPGEDGAPGPLERVAEVTGSATSLLGGEAESIGADGAVHVTEPRQHVPFGSDLVWRQGAAVELAPAAGSQAGTADMSPSGLVTGSTGDGRTTAAAVWQPGGGAPTTLPAPLPEADATTRGLAVNDQGHVVVESVRAYDHDGGVTLLDRVVALWAGGAYTELPALYGDGADGPSNLVPWDLNERGDVVGSASVTVDGAATRLAFLHRGGQTVDLNTLVPAGTGWTLNAAHSINERGQIIGIGTLDGRSSAFLLDPTRPLLVVPGAGASLLHSYDDPAGPEELWLGCGEDRLRLSRFPEDGPDQDVRAVDAARYLSCYTADGRSNDALNAYGGMLDQLTSTYGYREYQVEGQVERRTTAGCDLSQRAAAPNLFVFAYDWRQDNRISARELADYIGCIQQLHPGAEIDVVAHSMGSLVTRRYVLNAREAQEDHGLHEVVTIGAPWLGAPKLVNVINTGDFIERRLANGDPDDVKRVVSGFPAAHQLMSGPYYHDLAGAVFSEQGWDYDGDGVDREQYDWAGLLGAFDARWSRTAPADTAQSFQTHGGSAGQADWSDDPDGDLWTHVYGIQAGQNTIGRVEAVRDVYCTPLELLCLTRDHIAQRMTNGDGTVPTTSANRTSGDDDLNAPAARLVPVPVFDAEQNDLVEHTALTRHPRTLAVMMETFRGRTARAAAVDDKPQDTTADYRYVTARGVRDVVLHRGAPGSGESDAPLEDGSRILLPGSQHLRQGASGSLVTMPADVNHQWTVTFAGTGEPMSLESLTGTQEAPDTAVRWRDVVVPDGTAAELVLTPGAPERLRVDTDGDGSPDTEVPPAAELEGDAARDVEPPTVALAATQVEGQRRYAVTATDGRDGSGVRRVLWSLDGQRFAEYTAPVPAPLAATLFAFAEDWAGNRSPLAELDLHAAVDAPLTTLRLDPAPTASGWSVGATTATLTAEAGGSDGAPVAAVRYRTTGAQETPETTVTGATAQVVVDVPGRTTLWFSAVAEDGTEEPWRQQVLRVDGAAPSVRLRTPVAGKVVQSVGQVAGSAADDVSGVRRVEVLLERTADGASWDGEAWVDAHTWLPATGTTAWRVTDVPSAEQLEDGGYAVRARVTDRAGRVTTSPATTFTKAPDDYLVLTELGLLPEQDQGSTSATSVNDRGTAVGVVADPFTRAVQWRNGVPSLLQVPGSDESWAWAVAADGTVAGQARTFGGDLRAVRWSPDGSPQVLPHLPGETKSMPAAVSSAGAVGHSGPRPAWWRPDGSVVELPVLVPGQTGAATAIDEAGTIAGSVTGAGGVSRAVVWTEGGTRVTDLGTLGGQGAAALAMNEVGQVVGWAADGDGRRRPFLVALRDGQGMTELPAPDDVFAQANSIGDDGTVVGEYVGPRGGEPSAFVIADGVFADLAQRLPPLSEWVPTRINDTNGIGQVTGFGLRDGEGRGFLASAPHVPVADDVAADTDAGTPVRLRLAASDPDPGTTLTLAVVDRPASGTLSAVEGDEVVYTPAPGFSGTDRFTFQASDGRLRSNTATVTVEVRRGADDNQRPQAVVTAPATAPEGSTVQLDGSGSSDADGSVVTFAWDLDGDGAFDDATGKEAQLQLGDQGARQAALQVTDDDGATGVTSISVEAVNVAPLVTLPATASVDAGAELRLEGGFSDPGPDTWTATVDTAEGPVALSLDGTAFAVTASWPTAGRQAVVVRVCDDDGGCSSATTQVEVRAGNAAPSAVLPAPAPVVEGSTVALDGSGSSDSDGSVVAYAWDLDGDGAQDDATGATTSLLVPQDGTRRVGLRVTDDDGATATTAVDVVVTNAAPEVALPAGSTAVAGAPWSLPGSFTDPGADAWTATVDDGSGPRPLALTEKGFTVSTTFAAPGTRVVRVEVCDGAACGTRSVTVTVAPAPTRWPWEGFFAPVDNVPAVNTVQAGRAIPMKFSLGGDRGRDIFAGGSPSSQAHACGSSGGRGPVEPAAGPGSSALSYSPGNRQYQYVWKTEKSWAGQCRTFTMQLTDGSVHTAEFRFR